MIGKKLSYKQNLRAAIVFLNMFGLFVDENETIYPNGILKVFDLNKKETGTITFEEDRVVIMTQTDLGLLSASYQMTEASGFRDLESARAPRYAEWYSKINYIIEKNNSERFEGTTLIACSIDDEFGIKCSCHHALDYFVNDNKIVSLKIQLDGKALEIILLDQDIEEDIIIMPFDDMNGFIIHDIKKGEWSFTKDHEYRKYSGVFSAGRSQKHQFRAFTVINENKKKEKHQFLYENDNIKEAFYDKVDYDEELDTGVNCQTVVKMGKVMQEWDPDMYFKIDCVKEALSSGNISLLDSFISTGFERYTDEMIEALFGIERKPLTYGGNIRTLKLIYYGEKNPFLLNE